MQLPSFARALAYVHEGLPFDFALVRAALASHGTRHLRLLSIRHIALYGTRPYKLRHQSSSNYGSSITRIGEIKRLRQSPTLRGRLLQPAHAKRWNFRATRRIRPSSAYHAELDRNFFAHPSGRFLTLLYTFQPKAVIASFPASNH